SGLLAPTLGLSLKLAVDAVFPTEKAATETVASDSARQPETSAPGAAQNQIAKPSASQSVKGAATLMPSSLKRYLDELADWFRPAGKASKARLLLVICFIPASMFLRSLLSYLNTYLLSWVAIRAANDLRVRLFRHLMHLPLRFFNRASTGDLMTR